LFYCTEGVVTGGAEKKYFILAVKYLNSLIYVAKRVLQSQSSNLRLAKYSEDLPKKYGGLTPLNLLKMKKHSYFR
jgi:hypothetical protein